MRVVFHDWRAGLALGDSRETAAAYGVCHLRAMARKDRVRVALTATVNDAEEQA